MDCHVIARTERELFPELVLQPQDTSHAHAAREDRSHPLPGVRPGRV